MVHTAPSGPGAKSSCNDPLLPGAEVIGPVVNPVGLRGCQRLHAPPGQFVGRPHCPFGSGREELL